MKLVKELETLRKKLGLRKNEFTKRALKSELLQPRYKLLKSNQKVK